MFCEFIRTEVATPTTWMHTNVVFYPFVSNFMDCQIQFEVKTFTTSAVKM